MCWHKVTCKKRLFSKDYVIFFFSSKGLLLQFFESQEYCNIVRMYHEDLEYILLQSNITVFTALSSSQSLNMINGDLPPSSRETFFRLVAAL